MTTEPESQPLPPMSRKEFFVDTKTTCFLCLKEMQYSPPVIDLESDEDHNDRSDLDGIEGEKFLMKPIFRYLNVNPDILFKNQVPIQDSIRLLKKVSDWRVRLCPECIPCANRISELALQLEMIQMKMNHSVQKFLEIVDKSEKDSEKVEKFRGKLTNPSDVIQATIATLLRNETREKCNAHFKKSSPKVNVKILKKASPTADIAQPAIQLPSPPPCPVTLAENVLRPGNIKCKICNAVFGARDGLRQHMQRRHPEINESPIKLKESSTKLKEFTTTATTYPRKKGRIRCHICRSIFSSSSSLNRHMKHIHPNNSATITCNKCGLLFPSKPDWIKHTRLYCISLRSATTSSQEQSMQPPHPPPISDIPLATVNLTKMIDSIPHLKTTNNNLLCALCPLSSTITSNEIFQREGLLRRHMFLNHLDYFFGPVKLPEVSSEKFKQICKEIVENNMKPTQNPGLSGGSGQYSSLTFACTHCSSTFYEKRAMNAHLIRSHYDMLSPKVIDHQRKECYPSPSDDKQPTPVEISCTSSSTTSSNQLTFKCEDCSLMFRNRKSLDYHRQYKCQILLQSQPSSSNGGEAALDQLVEAHLQRFQKRRSEEGYPGKYRCAECTKTFSHRTSLCRHRSATNHNIGPVGVSEQVLDTDNSCENEVGITPLPPALTCQHCKKKFSSSSTMGRHQRQHCPVLFSKGGVEQHQSGGVTVVMEGYDDYGDLEQNYFYGSTEGGEEMGIEEEGIRFEEEAFEESYVNTKIELIEMDQIQILPKMEGGQEDGGYKDNFMVMEEGGGEEEMILP